MTMLHTAAEFWNAVFYAYMAACVGNTTLFLLLLPFVLLRRRRRRAAAPYPD